MATKQSVLEAISSRRSYYQLNKTAPISDSAIQSIFEKAVLHVPSSFNAQSARLVLLLNHDHDQFWQHVSDILTPLTQPEQRAATQSKLAGFQAAYGTALFYEDPEPVAKLRAAWPRYAAHMGAWSEATSAMHQFALWVALEAEGFGANLQHYNPLIDDKAAETWGVPRAWELKAQLVFGGRAGEPREKQYEEVEGKRLFVHGAKEEKRPVVEP